MIQRIQSIWLLLAGVAGLLTYKLPLWQGKLQDGSVRKFLGPESLLLFTLIVVTSVLAFVTIFLFKNRSQQKMLALIGALLSIGIVALEFFQVEEYKNGTEPRRELLADWCNFTRSDDFSFFNGQKRNSKR